jgi:small-conductance mechanosensitive channel
LEKEIGANIELKNKSSGLKVGSYTTNSDYVFCPDKNGFNIRIYKNLNNWKMWMKYKRENLDYDSEIEKEKEFNFGVSLRF